MQRNLILLASFALLLSGCGAGGGGDESPAAGTTTGDTVTPVTTELGARAVPGGTVMVTALTALTAGQVASFRIATAGMDSISTVEVLLGTDFSDAQPLAVTADAGAWLATTTLPDPLPATCRVLVRLTDASGAVQETGVEDFTIAVR